MEVIIHTGTSNIFYMILDWEGKYSVLGIIVMTKVYVSTETDKMEGTFTITSADPGRKDIDSIFPFVAIACDGNWHIERSDGRGWTEIDGRPTAFTMSGELNTSLKSVLRNIIVPLYASTLRERA